MGEPAPGGGTKLDAAREAVRSFVRQLRLSEGDRAAIVAFNARATVLAHLTSNSTLLDRALASITLATQTRLELAIAAAHTELVAGRGPVGNHPVIVLLTDGRSNPSTPAEAIASADAARRDRIDIYVVGLGADLDLATLQRIAGSPNRFFRAPSAADLAGIYARLIQRIPCDGSRYWGRR
jgi:Mg-chelatase subunit ChlD